MGTVELRLRDLFSDPCDMIVLPCSTAGTITDLVRDRLEKHSIPFRPLRGRLLGDVAVHPFDGGETIAQYVAYATSVDGRTSDLRMIEFIGRQLGDCTKQNAAIRFIAAPLLGTGAGGLSAAKSAERLAEGFKSTSHADARLIICVIDEELYRQAKQASHSGPTSDLVRDHNRPIRVFISYSQNSPSHSQWVTKIGTFLRTNGVDARLDAWHLRAGMDLQHFMQNEIALADRVIVITDKTYAEKADGRHGGVGWETMLIQGDIKDLPPDSIKYIIVAREASFNGSVPLYLKTKFALHWPLGCDERAVESKLLKEIYNAVDVPPLGRRPAYL